MNNLTKLTNQKAVIFDMDGLLVDSEPLWAKAMIKIFKLVNVSLTESECAYYQGIRIEELVPILHKKYSWKQMADEKLSNLIIDEMLILLKTVDILP